MNSSGIKRGLAASAVSALAVAGIPALASSANAAAGDTLTFVSAGPALNGGGIGAVVNLKAKHGTVVATDLALVGTSSGVVGSEDTADQNAAIVGTTTVTVDAVDPTVDNIVVHIAVTTTNTGDAAAFRVIDNDGTDAANLEASEARVPVSVSTAGPLAAVTLTPASQSTAQGQTSGAYTATVKDSAGRTTQLNTGQTIAVSADDATITPSDASITAAEIDKGTYNFTAATTGVTPTGTHVITLDPSPAGVPNATANLVVTAAAAVNASMVDIVTAADSWDGFGNTPDSDGDATRTLVRVDQASVRIDIKGSTPNGTVTLNLGGGDVTFGGKATSTISTVLDANGNGSLTITPDAFTVQDGDEITVGGSFSQTLEFQRSAPDAVEPASDLYFSALKATTSVKVTVVDQFGNPVTTGFIGAQRRAGGPNADATTQNKPVGADGTATFDFTDTKATVGQQDTVDFFYVPDQFSNTPTAFGSTVIKYTATGQGADFNTSLDTVDTGSSTYKASDVTVVPLADSHVNGGVPNESADVVVSGAEVNQEVTLSVDNGALILKPGDSDLSKGVSSVSAATNGAGTLNGYQVIGTKSGVVTLTIASANRTETAQFTVAAQSDTFMARTVTVSGPAEVESGATQIAYTAVITDAFGNPIAGFGVNDLNIQVTGPAQFQDSDALTNANGELTLNVRVDSGAEGDVTIKVTGLDSQFGAAADRLTSTSPTDDAKGLPVSSNVATATTTVKGEVVSAGIGLRLDGHGNGAADDKVTANAKNNAAGLTAVLYRGGKKIASHKLNRTGNYQFLVGDVNGKKATKYVVKVAATDTTQAGMAKKSLK